MTRSFLAAVVLLGLLATVAAADEVLRGRLTVARGRGVGEGRLFIATREQCEALDG